MSSKASEEPDWRSSIEQSYRNSEVREVAKVLASLEPGATQTSKLRLAMQFEDGVFKGAANLVDYRKKLSKRLKKLQKQYVPVQPEASSETVKELHLLRNKYGDSIRYIREHGSKAVAEMKVRHGEAKASQLKQHIDGVRHWMSDLGMLENSKANVTMSADHLMKLKNHLERRVENIRSHVVKLADPNEFLLETLKSAEVSCQGKAAKIMSLDAQQRYEQLQKHKVDPAILLQESLQTLQQPVPLPTRTQQNDEKAALVHLDKMRAASTTMLAYSMVTDKTQVPRESLSKAHSVAMEGIHFVRAVMKTYRNNHNEADVSLEDAWIKHLELPDTENPPLDGQSVLPPAKRRRREMITRSKVLLTPGRAVSNNVLAALRMKRVRLVQPGNGSGAHLELDFGTAFSMTIYLVPLLVAIRAYQSPTSGTGAEESQNLRCASWNPLQQGLDQHELAVWGVKGSTEMLGKVVKERLRDASTRATQVLRQCFATANKETAADFEREVLEFNALNQFLSLVRTTYIPNWRDA